MRGEGISQAVVQLTLMELSNVSCEGMRSLRIFAGAVPDFLSNSSSAQLRNLVGTFCDPISGGEVVIESGASGQLAVFMDAPSATFKERENGGEREMGEGTMRHLLTCISYLVIIIRAGPTGFDIENT